MGVPIAAQDHEVVDVTRLEADLASHQIFEDDRLVLGDRQPDRTFRTNAVGTPDVVTGVQVFFLCPSAKRFQSIW